MENENLIGFERKLVELLDDSEKLPKLKGYSQNQL